MREPDPQLRDDDVDRRFAEIVAGWHLTGTHSDRNAGLAKGVGSTALDDPTAGARPDDAGSASTEAPSAEALAADAGPEPSPDERARAEAARPEPKGADDPHGKTPAAAPPPTAAGDGAAGPDAPRPPVPGRSPINPPLFDRRPIRRTPPPPPTFPVWRGATNDTPYDEILDQVEDEDHFEPPEPRPLPPQEDLHFWGILVGLVGGPLLLLWLVLFRPDVAGWWMWLAIAMSLGGFVLLVLRGPSDNDPGNGAVV